MIRLTLAEVAAVTGGRLTGRAGADTVVSGPVVVDSRSVVPGAVFVALPGERVDGHDFAGQAVSGGAVAALVARPPDDPDLPAVLVDDPVLALGALAREVCDRLPALTVVGVTGSSGKTSTKDLLAVLLADLAPTVAPQNSFNNEVGVPLTALRCTERTRFLVAEMGARRPGNIAYLCRVTPPDLAVVLNVGAAHSGVFGSREATAATKGELPAALRPDGVAVLNAEDPYVRAMASRTAGRVVLTGTGPDADVRATGITVDDQARARFTLTVAAGPLGEGGSVPVALGLHGEHHVANALAAAAVALLAGARLPRVADLLGAATAVSRGRMAVAGRPDGVLVVNDAYNANPDSVRAALRALVAMRRPGSRTWAVLGEMLELGEASDAEHAAAGLLAAELGVDRVVGVGEGARPAVEAAGAAGPRADWVPDAGAGLDLLRADLRPGDVVLVKASRAIGLDRLAEELLAGSGPLGVPGGLGVPGVPGGLGVAGLAGVSGVAGEGAPAEPVQDGPVGRGAGAGVARGAVGEVAR